VLFSSHILQEVEAICDRVIIINKGTIVADDALQNLQKNTSGQVVKVRFKEPLEAEWLRRLPAVKTVHKETAMEWTVETDDAEAVRRALLQLAVQQNLNIVSLQNESSRLEDVFRTLTGNA
jgi:ABC-2 type transport system ATP-binding protein